MTIGRLIVDKRFTPLMRGFYKTGMFRLKFKSSAVGAIPFDYELDGRKNRPSYTYRVHWNYWNPMNILFVATIILCYCIGTAVWLGIKGLLEILPDLWKAFVFTQEQHA